MLVASLVLLASATEVDQESQRVCLLQLHKKKQTTGSARNFHHYTKEEQLPCGVGLGCNMKGLDMEGYTATIQNDGRSLSFAGAKTQSYRIEKFDNSACEEACSATDTCAGFLLSAHPEYSTCDFLDKESINCVGTASAGFRTKYTCFKKTAGESKYRAHQDRQYDRYDMASLFDYAFQSVSCETASSSSSQELVDQINTIRHVLDYRVGDVLKRAGYFWLDSREKLMDSRYDGTALQKVLKRCDDLRTCKVSIADFGKELASIGQARGFPMPGNDTIVAYIRAGDVIDEEGTKIGNRLLNPDVQTTIRSALADGYKRLKFVVVEAYADREERGLWMYTEGKHKENRRQLLAVLQQLLEFLCSAENKPASFGVVSPVNVDETLFYMMHASMFIRDGRNAGFTTIAEKLAKSIGKQTTIV